MATPEQTLAAIQFTAYGIVLVAGAAFTYYSLRNYALDRMEGHEDFWGYLSYLGLAFSIFGACGLVLVAWGGKVASAFADVSLLFGIAFIAFAMREVYYNSALAPAPDERERSLEELRQLEFGFVVVIAAEWVVVLFLDQTAIVATVKGLGAIAFAAYGVAFSERLESLAHGTAVDTLRRHLLLVLVCATGFAVADLAAIVGPPTIATSMSYVFLVLLGGLLVPPTIRLQQSVAGLS